MYYDRHTVTIHWRNVNDLHSRWCSLCYAYCEIMYNKYCIYNLYIHTYIHIQYACMCVCVYVYTCIYYVSIYTVYEKISRNWLPKDYELFVEFAIKNSFKNSTFCSGLTWRKRKEACLVSQHITNFTRQQQWHFQYYIRARYCEEIALEKDRNRKRVVLHSALCIHTYCRSRRISLTCQGGMYVRWWQLRTCTYIHSSWRIAHRRNRHRRRRAHTQTGECWTESAWKSNKEVKRGKKERKRQEAVSRMST